MLLSRYFVMDLELAFPSVQLHSYLRFFPLVIFYQFHNLIYLLHLIISNATEIAQASLVQLLGIRWSSIFYVESIARVRRLSLSGLLLYKFRMADQLFVQWQQLQRQYPRATYVGRLM